MEWIDNKNKTLLEDLSIEIKNGSKASIAAACFSIYAFQRESGKVILTLSDQDLLKMADIKAKGDREPAELLSDMLDKLLVHLEK